jgi:GAF domain-containing protein
VAETVRLGFTEHVSALRDDVRTERAAHAAFLETGAAPAAVRTVVADSWLRSAAAGVDADANLAPVLLDGSDLRDYRSAHPLAQVFPLLYDVLGRIAEDCDYVMAIGDAMGQLLWVCGTPSVLRQAESINFVEGAGWDEANAGTNAPGTALRLDAPVQIHAGEHFNRLVQPWSCAAAPIHDPGTQAILGLIDITGGDDVASPQTLGMVRAAARMAEAELGRLSAVGAWTSNGRAGGTDSAAGGHSAAHPAAVAGSSSARIVGTGWTPPRTAPSDPPTARPATLRVLGLGRFDCDAQVHGRAVRLSPRHGEIIAILIDHPDGLTADELALLVYPGDVNSSTVRAELTRLRQLLGPDVLQSRPYRLVVETDCDWHAVAAHLAAGRLHDAVGAYRGPLLPHSDAPGVVERRERLQGQLRAAILAGGEPELMVAWTRARWGADDVAMWVEQARCLPASSPLRAMAQAEARRLERGLTAAPPSR